MEERKDKEMAAKVISFINLKGGVAKTTTTVGTAFALAEHFHKKVLVIDLDPQTNATSMLIGEERWAELDEENSTLYNLFLDAVDGSRDFSLRRSIQKNVGNIKDAPGVDLLPSGLKMIYLQDEIYDIQYNNRTFNDPYMVLDITIGPVMNDYDYILIDCPPNLGILSLNGIQISDGYVIPCIPDILSTYGISQIQNRISIFAHNKKLKVKLLGIVFTKTKKTAALHTRIQEDFRNRSDAPCFKTVFYENSRYAEAAEYMEPLTFRQKWGGSDGVQPYYDFCQELMERVR